MSEKLKKPLSSSKAVHIANPKTLEFQVRHPCCWRAVARQLPILYNSEKKAKSVGCKIEDMRSRLSFFISGHTRVPENARGNFGRFRATVQLK